MTSAAQLAALAIAQTAAGNPGGLAVGTVTQGAPGALLVQLDGASTAMTAFTTTNTNLALLPYNTAATNPTVGARVLCLRVGAKVYITDVLSTPIDGWHNLTAAGGVSSVTNLRYKVVNSEFFMDVDVNVSITNNTTGTIAAAGAIPAALAPGSVKLGTAFQASSLGWVQVGTDGGVTAHASVGSFTRVISVFSYQMG